MDFRKRHEELLEKVRTGILMTRDEMLEAERLGKALVEADRQIANSPELAERVRILQEGERNFVWQQICSAVVNGHQAIDNDANREQIASWIHAGEEINNPQEWFIRILRETPSLGGKLSWQKYLTPQQKKVQAEKDQKASRVQALAKCRQHDLSECESNLHILMNHDGVVTWVAGGPTLMTDVVDEGEIPLVPATQAELQKYAQEKQDKHQAYLRELRDKNDIAGLQAAREQERQQQQQTQELTWRQKQMADLIAQYERDTQAGYVTPLPSQYTKTEIYKWDGHEMRRKMERYGASRITARLMGVTEVSTNHGTIRFE